MNWKSGLKINEAKNRQFWGDEAGGERLDCYNLKNTHNFTFAVSGFSDGLYIYKLLVDSSE